MVSCGTALCRDTLRPLSVSPLCKQTTYVCMYVANYVRTYVKKEHWSHLSTVLTGRHKGKSLAAPSPCHVVVRKLTDSDDQLISSPIDCSTDGVMLLDGAAPTPVSNQSEDDAETDSKCSCDSTNKVRVIPCVCVYVRMYVRVSQSIALMTYIANVCT